jgi:Creatinase/Prolidase N-terminal domain
MRRGLISRSLVELPDAALDARLARLRAAMAAARLDALLVYTNNTRPAGVSWLCGFVPYFSEALLVLGRTGAPVLVVALTLRVKPWIERTSRVGEVVHAPRIGIEAARLIAGAQADAAVGVVEFDSLPAGITGDLREAAPGLALTDASELFAAVRGRADPTEIMLATAAAAIAAHALAAVPAGVGGGNGGSGAVIAAVENAARRAGAEEIYIAVAPDLARDRRLVRMESGCAGDAPLGAAYAVRASVAYKGCWVRRTRTLLRDEGRNPAAGATCERAAARFAAALAQLPDPRALEQFASFLVEGCRIAQPLEPLMGTRMADNRPPAAGAVVSVQAAIIEDGQPILLGAPALIGGPGEAASIISPVEFS